MVEINPTPQDKNLGIPFSNDLLKHLTISDSEIQTKIQTAKKNQSSSLENLLSVLKCIDLTTLQGDDTKKKVKELCRKASLPLPSLNVQVAAVCIYPVFVELAKEHLSSTGIKIATVAAGFPHGLSPFSSRLDEVKTCAEMGADEIDIVIRREHVLNGEWEQLYHEVKAFKQASSPAKLKVILATGELGTTENIYKASVTAMMAGADFIKTSTGKEEVNATLEAGCVMMQAIKDYKTLFNLKVGLKPAGGIKSSDQAMSWWQLLQNELGEEWQNSNYFRIGASSLVDDIATKYFKFSQ